MTSKARTLSAKDDLRRRAVILAGEQAWRLLAAIGVAGWCSPGRLCWPSAWGPT
ncbi:hypothetical protein OG851_40280 [Streptomyces sp. NBC_00161]|uniref:hypothetical protein n=1 Tax=Streptomyces sp. NBC_00161 TaxID=2975671 RepID=UPI0032549A4E